MLRKEYVNIRQNSQSKSDRWDSAWISVLVMVHVLPKKQAMWHITIIYLVYNISTGLYSFPL